MRKSSCAGAAFIALLAAVGSGATEKVPLADGWRFTKADDPAIGTNYDFRAMAEVLDRAERGDLTGAPATDWCRPGFDDSAWKVVRVPHDWGVESAYDPTRRYGDAFLDVIGVGWYRKEFRVSSCAFLVSAEWKGGAIGDVSVFSEKGEDCLVWGEWTVTDADGRTIPTDHDEYGRLRFRTVAGGRYQLKGRL